MEIRLSETAKRDIQYFLKTGQRNVLKKIEHLLNEVVETPYAGSGKPEPLKYELSGKWSRRITHEHRMIYKVIDYVIEINSLRGHYDRK